MLSFFPRGVSDEILNLIESVSEDFPSYFFNPLRYKLCLASLKQPVWLKVTPKYVYDLIFSILFP